MVYYTALPLIMKSENGSSQLCLNQNQLVMNGGNSPYGPSSGQPQVINLQNADVNSSPLHQQSSYTYQLLTSNDQSQSQQHAPQQSSSYHRPQTPKGAKIFKCEQCNMNFGSKSALTSHLKSHAKLNMSPLPTVASSSPSTTPQSSDPYQCDVCKKTFAVPARLVRHYRTHTGERPFECEFCHKMFSVKENLQVHRRIHTKERPYRCDVCGRAFEHSGKLHRHMRIHTGERPHKCNVCGKTFIQSGQLVIHMRTHTGEKPYKCQESGCGKGFTCSKQLKVHSRTHTGEKPYHCDICFRDFGYNHVLKLHRVQHYGSKCYKCTICDETFKNKKEMEAHIKGHANEMPDDDASELTVEQQANQSPPLDNKHNILSSESHPLVAKYEVNASDDNATLIFGQGDHHTISPQSSLAATTTTANLYPDTPKDSEASSEQNSDGDDITYMNMYSRYEQSVMNNYGVNSGVNNALIAAASITAATMQPLSLTTTSSSSESGNSSFPFDSSQMAILRQNSYFPPQVSDYKSSNLVRCVEAALELTPPRSSPESPDRSSSPESDSVQMADRDNNTLPPRKRKLYFKDNQSSEQASKVAQASGRINSVIQFAKAN